MSGGFSSVNERSLAAKLLRRFTLLTELRYLDVTSALIREQKRAFMPGLLQTKKVGDWA